MKIGFTPEKLALKLMPDVLKLLSSLKPGQTLAAKVISQDPSGQTLLDIMGSRLKVDVGRPLKQGDQLLFEVVKDSGSKDVPTLKLLDAQPGAIPKKIAENNEPAPFVREKIQGPVSEKPTNLNKGAVIKAVLNKLPSFFEDKLTEKPGANPQLQSTIPARVLKALGNDKLVFSVKGEEIQAKVSGKIQEGRVVFLEKMKPGPSTEFRVLQPDIAQNIRTLAALAQTEGGAGVFPKLIGMMSKILQNVKPDKDGVRQLPEPRLEKLMQAIENLSLKSDEPKPDFLNRIVKEGGLAWENKLASADGNPEIMTKMAEAQDDIKGLIMDILSDSSSLSPDVGRTLEAAFGSIENLQIMNRISTSEAGIFFLPFPILFQGAFSFGQVFFDMPENSPDEKLEKPFRVSIILNMTELGKIRADISFLKKKISGAIIVGSEDVQALLSENLHDLEKNLLERGFESADISVRLPRSSVELDSSSVFSSMVEKNDGLSILV